MPIPYLAQQPVDDYGFVFSDLKFSATLAASTDTALTIPGAAPAYKAIIKASFGEGGGPTAVWVALNETAAAPVGASFAATGSDFLNAITTLCRQVKAGDVLHFFTTGADVSISVVLYKLDTTN